jgi:hypothetical protein
MREAAPTLNNEQKATSTRGSKGVVREGVIYLSNLKTLTAGMEKF